MQQQHESGNQVGAIAMLRGAVGAAFVSVALLGALPAAAGDSAETAAAQQDESIPSEQTNHPQLEDKIGAIVDDSPLEQMKVAIHVEDLSNGAVVYSRNSDELMNPASNVKLLTAAVVLDELGPNHTYSTQLSTRELSDGRLDDLYVRGEGEAFLLFEDVLGWIGKLKVRGVEAVDGDLVIDDGIFDEAYLPPGFDMRDAGAAYRSPIGAVSVNFNAVLATVKPADTIGESPTVRLHPPNDHVQIENRARTTAGRLGRMDVEADVDDNGRTTLTVSGAIGIHSDPRSQRKRIDDPPAFAGSVIAGAMEMMGIEFDGQIRRGTTPEDAEPIVEHQSKPVMESVWAMNKWSNNFMAEQLLRGLGAVDDEPSTWEAARTRARTIVDERGFVDGNYQWHNGSGLYDGNKWSARQMVELLQSMHDHRYGPEFASSLAIAGVDGTLKHRLDGESTKGNIRAKTGTLRDVTALSGYAETVSGRPVAFSILLNDTPRRAWNYRDLQDDIARAIVEFDQ